MSLLRIRDLELVKLPSGIWALEYADTGQVFTYFIAQWGKEEEIINAARSVHRVLTVYGGTEVSGGGRFTLCKRRIGYEVRDTQQKRGKFLSVFPLLGAEVLDHYTVERLVALLNAFYEGP